MTASPSAGRARPADDRPRRGLSIAVKLPLFIGALLVGVVALNTWGDYHGHMQEERAEAAKRLTNVAGEFVQTLTRLRLQLTEAMAPVAADPTAAALLTGPSAAAPPELLERLRRLAGDPQTAAVELRDRTGATRVRVVGVDAGADTRLNPALLARADTSDSAAVGRLRQRQGGATYAVAMRVRGDAGTAGYLVLWRRLISRPASRTQVARLIGTGGQVYVGNTADSTWTNLSGPAVPPPLAVVDTPGLHDYRRASVGRVIAVSAPVADTPWSVVVEFPADSVRAPVLLDVRHLLWIDALALLVGLVGAWLLSRRFTRRLSRLTEGAESMAAPGPRATAPGDTGDEVERLGRAFDAMRQRVHDALAQRAASEELYRGIFESVPLPLYVVDLTTLRFLAVNQAAVEQYGYTRDEFLAMTLRDIRPEEDVVRLEASVARMTDRPESRGVWRHVRKNGSALQAEIVAHALLFNGRAAFLVVANDVTERHRAAEALRRSEERYRRLVHEAPYGIELSTLDGRMLDANPAVAHMLGYDRPEELIGSDILDLYADPADRELGLRQLHAAGYARMDRLQWKRRDGRLITVRFSGRLVRESEHEEPYIETIIEDVTDRLRLEEQFHQAQKMEAIGRLAGGIAHDFNNLLTVILTTTELLLDEQAAETPLRAELQDIYRSAQRGADLTRQLLAFSRRQVLSIHPLSVNELVVGIERMLRRLLGEDVETRVVTSAAADIARADAGQLEQVLLNLAVNARDAMPHGGCLTIETSHVDLTEAVTERHFEIPPGAYVAIAVSDTGEGMSREVQAHLFEPFFTTKPRDRGTGLGLATVYGIVKQLGGYIWCYSEPGKGTTFKIYLPRVDDAPRTPLGGGARRDDVRGTETVLIAEDEDGIRALLTRTLQSRGYTVLAGANGEEALALARSHTGPVDLLVTDVVMPGMSGPELAKEVVARHPEARVLFLSGYTDEAVVAHGLATGQTAFLQKPFTHNVLLGKVREVIEAVRP